MAGRCSDGACISRAGDKLDSDARLLVLPCEHVLCARCARRRVQEGKGSGSCAVGSCRASFRHDEPQDAARADDVALRREAQVRRRVMRAMPRDLEDFVADCGGDTASAERELAAYQERAEMLVMRLLDRTPLKDGGGTVAEAASKEIEALESGAGRSDRVAAARREREAGLAAGAIREAERAAREAEAAEVQADRARSLRLRSKRARETAAAVDGSAASGDDSDGPRPEAGARPPPLRSRASEGALAGVSSATASGARMRRPALPHVPPPRPLDRATAPQRFHDGRSAGSAALVAVASVERRAVARAEAAAAAGLLLGPRGRAEGPSSALGAAAARLSKRFARARPR